MKQQAIHAYTIHHKRRSRESLWERNLQALHVRVFINDDRSKQSCCQEVD